MRPSDERDVSGTRPDGVRFLTRAGRDLGAVPVFVTRLARVIGRTR